MVSDGSVLVRETEMLVAVEFTPVVLGSEQLGGATVVEDDTDDTEETVEVDDDGVEVETALVVGVVLVVVVELEIAT